jgi:hypothetical protein
LLYIKNNAHFDWQQIKNKFTLFSDDDLSTIYNGYIPLSCRLIEYGLTVPIKNNHNNILLKGWGHKNVTKIVSTVNTPFHVMQHHQNDITQLNKIVLVCFVGPVTYGEISVLRKLAKNNPDKHIIIMSTNIVNERTFINSFVKLDC